MAREIKYVDPHETRYRNYVTVSLDREEAKTILNSDVITDRLRNELLDLLDVIAIYQVKCQECGKTYKTETKVKLTRAEIHRGGICSSCEDDFK